MAEENKKAAAKQQKKPAEKNNAKNDNKPKQNKQNTADKQKKDSVKTEKLLEYKGKPLVRSGNTVYYGDMKDPYVVYMNIKNTTDLKDMKLAGTVAIQLISTDESLSPKDRMIKKGERNGLFNALDLGAAWLERQLKKG